MTSNARWRHFLYFDLFIYLVFSFVSKPYCLLHFYIFFLIQVANEYNSFRGDGLDLYRRSLKKNLRLQLPEFPLNGEQSVQTRE